MIVDAIASEKNGLWERAYVDGAHNTGAGMGLGDQWLAEITEQLHKVGVTIVYDDKSAIFPEGYPMTDCALYYGWYAGAVPVRLPSRIFVLFPARSQFTSARLARVRCVIRTRTGWPRLFPKARPQAWAMSTNRICNSRRTSTFSTIGCCTASLLPRAPICRSECFPGCR